MLVVSARLSTLLMLPAARSLPRSPSETVSPFSQVLCLTNSWLIDGISVLQSSSMSPLPAKSSGRSSRVSSRTSTASVRPSPRSSRSRPAASSATTPTTRSAAASSRSTLAELMSTLQGLTIWVSREHIRIHQAVADERFHYSHSGLHPDRRRFHLPQCTYRSRS